MLKNITYSLCTLFSICSQFEEFIVFFQKACLSKVAQLHYVTGVSVQMGMLTLDTRHSSDQNSRSPVFGEETESIDSICQNPTLADPYESSLVYPGISTVPEAGEGLFARTDIKAGQLIAFFNGVRTRAGGIENADYTIKSDDRRCVFDIPEECR